MLWNMDQAQVDAIATNLLVIGFSFFAVLLVLTFTVPKESWLGRHLAKIKWGDDHSSGSNGGGCGDGGGD